MPQSDPEVSLVVNGAVHEGWKSVTIRSSIDALCQDFSVDYSPRWLPTGDPARIKKFDSVQVRIGDAIVLTGYCDGGSESYDSTSHDVSAVGRSKTEDLFDCAAETVGGAIKGKNLLEAAKRLCDPFTIDVTLSEPGLDVGGPVNVQLQDGASVFETLSELARAEGVLLLTDIYGNLVLSRAASKVSPGLELRTGLNIKRGSITDSGRDRYSDIKVRGQAPGSGVLSALGGAQLKYAINDPDVPRYRPLVLHENEATLARLKQRAIWERNTRAGRSQYFTYDVQGWLAPNAKLWTVNTLCPVRDTVFGIDTQLLISGVDFNRTLDGGRTARIEVCARETYDVAKPPKPPKRKKGLAALLG